MNALALTLLLASSLGAAPAWETWADPGLGVELLRPAGWTVQTLGNGALQVVPPPPLGGTALLLPLSAPGLGAAEVVNELARRAGGQILKRRDTANGHAATVRVALDGGTARLALVNVAVNGDRALVAVLTAPENELEAARPALAAIAQSARFFIPGPAEPVPERPLMFEPFREPREQAFTGELPGEWSADTSVAIVQGPAPYVRASVIGRSPDQLYAFAHYKLASFQVPVKDLTPDHPGFRFYEPGALVLERYLFPEVAKKDPRAFGGWHIERRGPPQVLFSHPGGVRFDGQLVDYAYRYRGQRIEGRAYVVTYHLPQEPSPVWFLYGLYGWEAPPGRATNARLTALRLLQSFTFEGRYAPQADRFWYLARDAALGSLSDETSGRRIGTAERIGIEALAEPFARASAALSPEPGTGGEARLVPIPVQALVGADGAQVPAFDFTALEDLR